MSINRAKFLLDSSRHLQLVTALRDGDDATVLDISTDIYDSIIAEMGKEWSYGAKDVDALQPPRKFWLRCCEFESDVNNGGFDQFMYNFGDLVKEAHEAHRFFGIESIAGLIEQLLRRWPDDVSFDLVERRTWLDSTGPQFEDLDDVFFSETCNEGTSHDERMAWAAANPAAFFQS